MKSRSLFFLGAFLLVTGGASLMVGTSGILPAEVLFGLWRGFDSPTTRTIILELRLPRIVLGGLVGGALASAGTTLQGLLRNPLADPYIIGISSGASLGATLGMFLGMTPFAVPAYAFAGGLLTIIAVYFLARRGQHLPVVGLLLAGIALGAFLQANVSLLMILGEEQMRRVVFWLMGGLSGATWKDIGSVLPYLAAGFGLVLWRSRELDLLAFGEGDAQRLGVNTEAAKTALLAGASLLTAAAVSVSGLIAFVGLMVPHMLRLIFGPESRYLLVSSFLGGAGLLILCDTLARTVLSPAEIPVGVVTAFLGGPFFLYLLRQYGKGELW